MNTFRGHLCHNQRHVMTIFRVSRSRNLIDIQIPMLIGCIYGYVCGLAQFMRPMLPMLPMLQYSMCAQSEEHTCRHELRLETRCDYEPWRSYLGGKCFLQTFFLIICLLLPWRSPFPHTGTYAPVLWVYDTRYFSSYKEFEVWLTSVWPSKLPWMKCK